jgi:benzoylformate decarboxylase
LKGFEAFADAIRSLDLLPIFGNPGTTELTSLKQVDNYILTHFDGLSVGMADGLSQYTFSPHLVNLHTILGLGNSMAYIYSAKMNYSPVVITVGQQDLRHISMEPLLSGDIIGFVGNSVKFKYELKDASEISSVLRRAKTEALTPPIGPVLISIPMNIMDQDSPYKPPEPVKVSYDVQNSEAVERVSELLRESKNPALVFGWEIDLFDAFREAERVAEKLGCPVYGEPLAHRSPFNSSNRMFGGNLLPGSTLINLKLLQNDVVVFIGGDILLYPYLPSPILEGKKVIFVGLNFTPKFGEFYRANVKSFLGELEEKITKKGNFSKALDFQTTTKIANEKQKMGVTYVMSKVKRQFPDYVIVDEAISSSTVLRDVLGYASRRYFFNKSGQLGWGSPAAAGISMRSDKVLAIIGEGSFMYSLQILWTVKKYGLPVKFLVLRNGGYSILKSYSLSYAPGVEKKDYLSFDLPTERFAESFGIESMVADNELESLKWLSEGKEPRLLVVDVDRTIPKLFL